jgi:OOP family OmpA-OmpF porin
LGAGIQQAGSTLSPGYNTDGLFQTNLGFRYMFNERFGIRLDLGYNSFKATSESLPFKSNYYRASLEGVVNLGNILKFNTFSKRFGLLAHAGVGAASLNVTEPNDNGGDLMYAMNVGITPQYKLNDRFSLFLDFNSFVHFYQSYNFDGGQNTAIRESNISLMNASIGLNIALGKNKQSADFWNEELDEAVMDSELETLKSRLNTAEKEIAILKTKEVSPNKELIMTELDNRYVKRGEQGNNTRYSDVVTGSNVDFIKNLLNSGYINVYFDTNKSRIQDGSLNSVNYLKQFMMDNPYVNADLIGYADETGSPGRNKTLSQNRAKKVYDVLVAAGISPTRLSYFGGGEDKTVTKNARQLARKVTFKIR